MATEECPKKDSENISCFDQAQIDADNKIVEELTAKALDGSLEDAVELGRHYLKKIELGCHPEENGKRAVDWLTRASRKGSDAATELLQQCLQNGQGIDETNIEEVRWCVETPRLEKIAREAASSLFHQLNPLKSRTLTKEEFRKNVGSVATTAEEQKLLEKAGKKLQFDEGLTEEDFVNKVGKMLKGQSNITLSSLLTNDVEAETYMSMSWFKKLTQYPAKTAMYVTDHTVEYAAKQGMTWLTSMIPTRQIHMLLVFFLYSVLSINFLLSVIPLFSFYFFFLVMIVCTLQMFYSRKKMCDVKALAGMLNKFNKALDMDTAESHYTWSSLTPYFMFFGALIGTVLSFSLADAAWIPCSEFVVIGLFFTGSCFAALSNQYDHLAFIAIGCTIVSSLPAIFAHFPQIPVVYDVVQLFFGSVYAVEIIPEVHIQIGIPSMMYMIVPVLFIKMAMDMSWQGTYRVLIPHLVCFFWWQTTMLFYSSSTMVGLLRGSIGWLLAIFLLPIALIVVVIYFLIQLTRILTLSGLLKLATTMLLMAIPAGLAFWASKGFNVKGFSLDSRKGKFVLVALSIFTVIPIFVMVTPPEIDVGGKYLTWEDYRNYCSQPQWDRTNIADAETKCMHFKNMMVSWTGTIKKVVIKKVDNPAEGFIDMLPLSVGNWLKCTYGDKYPDCDEVIDATEKELCQLRTMQNHECHMRAYDRYLYEVWVKMEISKDQVHDVRVEAWHSFKDVLMQLKADDVISFRAALLSDLGNVWPVLKLYHVECKSCIKDIMSTVDQEVDEGIYGIFVVLKEAFYSTLNFFMCPLIHFG